MNNNKILFKYVLYALLFFLLGILTYVDYKQENYIEDYERLIAKQDSMINDLSFSNELVKKYFEIREDSLTHRKLYILKNGETITIKEKEYVEVDPTFNLNGEEITVDDLLDLYNKKEKTNNEAIRKFVEKYNSLIQQYNLIVTESNAKSDTLQMQAMALDLIRKNFDISFAGDINKPSISIHLMCEKADSAFALLNYYRDKMTYDPEKGAFIITEIRAK